jgi:hypothetical protein
MSIITVPRSSRVRLRPARTLWLELKRNAVPYVLPLLAAIFYFDSVRTADGFPPVWAQRASVIGDHMVFVFSAFAGGLAAWAGSREGRRNTLDLVATTPRAAWARLNLALAGTLCWLLGAFLAGVAVLYVQTALQATWGGPPLWPVVVGATAVTAVTMIGFVCGVVFPGRFTAPLVAIAVLGASMVGFREALSVNGPSSTYALLSPDNSPPAIDAGTYYHVAPDLLIVQFMFMGGIAVALFGVLGLVTMLRASAGGTGTLRAAFARSAFDSRDRWPLRAAAVVMAGCGVAASVTAFTLAGTARPDAVGGWQIPALHSAASDQPVPVTLDCTSAPGGSGASGFQVCLHPAFAYYRDDVAAALDPVAAQIAGLPGAPVRAVEAASLSGGTEVRSGLSGNPPVFEFTADHVGNMFGEFYGIPDTADWRSAFQLGLLYAFLTGSAQQAGFGPLDEAQQAVENGLLTAAGAPLLHPVMGINMNGKVTTPSEVEAVSAAAQRFAALPASVRHAWLAAHLAALRAGTVTLAELP